MGERFALAFFALALTTRVTLWPSASGLAALLLAFFEDAFFEVFLLAPRPLHRLLLERCRLAPDLQQFLRAFWRQAAGIILFTKRRIRLTVRHVEAKTALTERDDLLAHRILAPALAGLDGLTLHRGDAA